MKTIVQTYQEKFSKIQSRNQRFFICMLALSIVVVIFVFYNLRSMGIAQVNEIPENIADVADISANVEIASVWEETLPDDSELDGETYAEDIVLIAQSQLGYEESTTNFSLADDGSHYGYTRYGEWLGNPYLEKWDAAFVSFCLYYAGVSEDDYPYNSGTFAWAAQLDEEEYFLTVEEHTPEIGDLIFFDTIGDESPDTMGIVTEILTEDETESGEPEIKVIQGDYDDAVAEISYFVTSPTIVGYAELPEKPDEDAVLIATSVTSTKSIESYSVSMEIEEDSDVDDTRFVTDDVEIETLASTDSDSKYARTAEDQYPTTIPDAWAEQGYAIYTCTELSGGTNVNNDNNRNYGFWIWLYDTSDNPLFSSVEWLGSGFTIGTYIYDVLTNGDSYYIPLYYFTDGNYGNISIDDYDIDFGICPFEYAPDPNKTGSRVTTTSYEILTFEEKSYVYVKLDYLTLGNYAPARVNIYYTGETITPIVGGGTSDNDDSLYMWAYATENNITGATLDDDNGKVGGYSRWSSNRDIDKGIGVSGSTYSYTAYQYTANGEYCYLVPVEYFRLLYDTQDPFYKTSATQYSQDYGVDWTYDPNEPCPFYYDPNSNEDASSYKFSANYGTTKAEYVFADFEGTGTENCYVLLKTTQYCKDYGYNQPRFFVFYYTDFTMDEYVVTFSLGNEHGYVLDTHYNYDYYDYKFWGNDDTRTNSVFGGPQTEIEGRWYSKPLIDYADENGVVTINLPSDSDLVPRESIAEYAGGGFTVVSGKGSTLPDINMIFQEECNYDWKLIGWTNVITGEYYDVSNGATTADIALYDENGDVIYNVFYADWIAENYDYGSSDDTNLGGLDPDVVDTSSFVSIKMFDYSETFNLYSTNMEQTLSEENWSDANTFASDLGGNYIDGGETTDFGSFLFVNNASYSENTYALGYPNDRRYGNTYVGASKISGTTNLGIQNTDKGFLNILFDTDNETNAHGVYYVGNSNYLFELNDSTYTFDSRTHGTVYNQADQRFYVYNDPMYSYYYYVTKKSTNGIFLLYNDPSWSYDGSSDYTKPDQTKDMLDIYNGSTNYWFGMQIDVDFYNYGTSSNSNVNDITFKFYGDDDVWIFIDDQLVVDLSGIHDSEYAILNFTKGTIQIGMTDNLTSIEGGTDQSLTVELPVDGGCQNLADLGSAYGNTTYLQNYITSGVRCFVDTTTLLDDKIDAGQHHLTFYYLERGAWESNLYLEFNLIPNWQYETDSATAISVRKEWINLDGKEENASDLVAKVGLFAKVADAESALDETGTYYVTTIDDVDYYVDATDPDNPIQLEIGDEGLVYDTNGDIVAYYANNVATYLKGNVEDGALYLYVSEVELNSENGWNNSWRAIVNGPEYILLELEHNWNYYATALEPEEFSDENETESYQYWHIVGEAEIETLIQEKNSNNNIEYSIMYDDSTTLYYYEPTQILITDAGYNTAIPGEIGIQAEVLRNQTDDTSGVLTTKFLNISARPETIDNVDYFGLIDNRDVTDDVIWYLQGVSDTAFDDTTGAVVNMFYIFYYGEDGNRYYLDANEKGNNTAPTTLTATKIQASVSYNGNNYPDPYKNVLEFYYSNIGELFTTIGGGGDEVDDNSTPYNYKVIFDQNGSVTLTADGVSKLDPQNARIYMLAAKGDIETSGYAYILSNQESVGVLPKAGGSGIAIYLIVGGGVIAAAAVLLIRRRRAT